MGVVQAGDGPCFSLESVPQLGSLGEMLGQDFEGNLSVQARVFSEIDFSHAALA